MIRLENVSRRWTEFVIRDVTLEVATGEYLAIVGPTGAGKTLLLELILGIHHPDRGCIVLDDRDVTGLPPERRGIGVVYQDYVLFPHLDVERNLAFGLRYRPGTEEEKRRKVEEISQLLGIGHLLHRYPATLSGGERQRVAIGRALVTDPAVLLLDEPLSALDRGTARRLRAELKSLHVAKGLTIVHVTHDLAEARQLSDRVALFHDGQINAMGTAEELIRRPPNLFAANFFGAVNVFAACRERTGLRAGPITVDDVPKHDSAIAHLMILPDEVTLIPGPHAGSGSGRFQCEVTALIDEGSHVSVLLRAPELSEVLTVHVTRQSVQTWQLSPGVAVTADVSNAIHIVPGS